jgi:hypothetical protein
VPVAVGVSCVDGVGVRVGVDVLWRGVIVSVAGSGVSLAGMAVALGGGVGVTVTVLAAEVVGRVFVGATVVGRRVLVGAESSPPFPGGRVCVGAPDVGRRVGEGPAVGTVWKAGAPQDGCMGMTIPKIHATTMTMNSLAFVFMPIPASTAP